MLLLRFSVPVCITREGDGGGYCRERENESLDLTGLIWTRYYWRCVVRGGGRGAGMGEELRL